MNGIANPAKEYFKDGQWGWDGTVWRKLPMVWGYSEHWAGTIDNAGVAAGNHYLHSPDVPPGQLWVLQGANVTDVISNCTSLRLFPYDGTYGGVLIEDLAPVAGKYLVWSGEIVLSPGCDVRATIKGATLNDRLIFTWWGYKMKVAE